MTDPHAWGRGVTDRSLAARDVPAEVLALVEERDGPGCVECARLGLTPPADEPLELDHKQPLAQGGDWSWANLQWLCRGHNRAKRDRPGALGEPAWARRAVRP